MTQDQRTRPGDAGRTPPPRTGPVGWFGRPLHLEVRTPFEHRSLRRSPLWRGDGIPAGRGRPLLLIPGFLAGRHSVSSVAHVLAAAGWAVETASVGRNSGPAYVGVDAAAADLMRMYETFGPVTIVGHSRGGQFARVLAVRQPSAVAQVIAVGSPLLVKYPEIAVVKFPVSLLDRGWRAGAFGEVHPDRELAVDLDRSATFPTGIDFVSIYSRSDGIVDWRSCIEGAAVAIEVVASHRGLVRGVAGITAIGRALARQDGAPLTARG
ncbi:MAG: alpha/beta fold hydrolase [Actinomycetota bacterium]